MAYSVVDKIRWKSSLAQMVNGFTLFGLNYVNAALTKIFSKSLVFASAVTISTNNHVKISYFSADDNDVAI